MTKRTCPPGKVAMWKIFKIFFFSKFFYFLKNYFGISLVVFLYQVWSLIDVRDLVFRRISWNTLHVLCVGLCSLRPTHRNRVQNFRRQRRRQRGRGGVWGDFERAPPADLHRNAASRSKSHRELVRTGQSGGEFRTADLLFREAREGQVESARLSRLSSAHERRSPPDGGTYGKMDLLNSEWVRAVKKWRQHPILGGRTPPPPPTCQPVDQNDPIY